MLDQVLNLLLKMMPNCFNNVKDFFNNLSD